MKTNLIINLNLIALFFSLAIVENLGFGKVEISGIKSFSAEILNKKSGNNGFIFNENNPSIIPSK